MRGILFTELERYASARADVDTFDGALERLGARLAASEPYVTPGVYAREDLAMIVAEIANELAAPPTAIWRDFGRWSFQPLGLRYRMLVGHRDLASFFAGLERALRTEIPRVYSGEQLDHVTVRYAAGVLRLSYGADVPDCAFLTGLFEGAREYFRGELGVDELACRGSGAAACEWEART